VSLFNWLFPKPAPSGVSESPRPKVGAALAELKKMRHDRRDQLYGVVRDVMLRAEVLASHYKFKVLSLDTQGSQFLVMIDIMAGPLLEPDRLFRIENQINATAAERHSLRVKAVYWRQIASDHSSAKPRLCPEKPAVKAVSTAPSTAKDIAGANPGWPGRGEVTRF
jgi:hypothetical protein